jgi:tungstate transport system permease protein
MRLLWDELRAAVPLIFHGDPTLLSTISFTVQVALVATAVATLIGLPIGLAIGLGRFRGRGVLHALANATMALPPVLVGVVLFELFANHAPLGGLHLIFTRRVIFVGQTILALPYIVALSAAAFQGLPDGLTGQARLLGAGRLQLGVLALREARIGVLAAVIAALGTALSEVAAVSILGGNIYGYNQTLASSTLFDVSGARYSEAIAAAIVLFVLILLLVGSLGLLQLRGEGLRMRFRTASD